MMEVKNQHDIKKAQSNYLELLQFIEKESIYFILQ
jgi:hypothetical protein